MSILTLDLGTTYFKAAVFDRDGRIVALHREATPVEHPEPGWWEVDVERFRAAVAACLAALRAQRPEGLDDVEAITFATQTNSFVLLGEGDEPLTPLILWPDARAKAFEGECRRLADAAGFRAATGLPALGHEFMAAKLLWLRRERAPLWPRIRRVCLISDLLTLDLTGQHVTEAGAAGLTGIVQIHDLRWRPSMLEALGLERAWMPRIVRAGADLGPVLPRAAADLGLPPTCRFICGCLDQYAGAIGAGNVAPGNLSETTGTVLASVACSDAYEESPPPDVYQGPAFDPGKYFRLSFGTVSAGLLEAYRATLPGSPDYATLDREAAEIPPGSNGLRVRAGGGSIELTFENQRPAHTRGHHVRAIMEAVAYALARQVQRLSQGQPPREIRASGGAARSDVWLQIKADVLGIPITAAACPEPTSLGAAMLAARTLGRGPLPQLAERWIQTRRTFLPDPARRSIYQQLR